MKLKEPKFLDYTKQKPQVNSVLLTSLVVVMFYQNIGSIIFVVGKSPIDIMELILL